MARKTGSQNTKRKSSVLYSLKPSHTNGNKGGNNGKGNKSGGNKGGKQNK